MIRLLSIVNVTMIVSSPVIASSQLTMKTITMNYGDSVWFGQRNHFPLDVIHSSIVRDQSFQVQGQFTARLLSASLRALSTESNITTIPSLV